MLIIAINKFYYHCVNNIILHIYYNFNQNLHYWNHNKYTRMLIVNYLCFNEILV
jgi:hypothetical protein